jgi:hypothetical protein
LIWIKSPFPRSGRFISRNKEGGAMPGETIIVVAVIVGLFAVFSVVLLYADHTTRGR